jgi:Fis family transcriptional regulator
MTIIQGMTLRPAPPPQVQADQNAGAPAPALSEAVARAVRRYLADMGTHPTEDLYRIVLAEVERPLLDEVLRHCRGNQSRASQMLGITRATLRKKLAERQAARRKA